MSQPGDQKVVMIGLDAAEPRLIEQWTADGTLENLARLREGGAYGRLQSSADWLVGSPWPTFYTSTTPAEHGFYNYLGWRADRMACLRPDVEHTPLQPFWRDLSRLGPRVVVLDAPLTYQAEPFNGVEIAGWATHETLVPPYSTPESAMKWIARRFGRSARKHEIYKLMPPDELIGVRDHLIDATRRVGEVSSALMQREAWNLLIVGFAATHRGGHKLWDLAGLAGEPDVKQENILRCALRDVYIACDRAIGDMLQHVDEETTVLIFSLHGMGENTCRCELLPQMLDRILHGPPKNTGQTRPSLTKRLRKLVPEDWRHAVKSRLPLKLQDKLTSFWRVGEVDWSATKAFGVVADLQGYVRINLRGRERDGVVEPGAEYDEVCRRISEGLRRFVDADTGEPIVNDIRRIDEIYPQGAKRDHLPDLSIRWSFSPAAAHRAVTAPGLGEIDWPTPGKHFTGRSGNHRPEGFLLASGPSVAPGGAIDGAHILDLAPTVYRLFDQPAPTSMRGCALTALTSGA